MTDLVDYLREKLADAEKPPPKFSDLNLPEDCTCGGYARGDGWFFVTMNPGCPVHRQPEPKSLWRRWRER